MGEAYELAAWLTAPEQELVKRGSEFAVLAKPFGAADLSKAMTALLDETEAKREPSAARRG